MGLIPRGVVSAYKSGRSIVLRIPFWAYHIFAFKEFANFFITGEKKALFAPAEGSGLLKLIRKRGEPNSAYLMIGRVLKALGLKPWDSGTRYFRARICEFMGKEGLEVFFGKEVRPSWLHS